MGKAVLAGKQDAVRLNGIDKWFGGVHLQGAEAAWRWDEEPGKIVQIAVNQPGLPKKQHPIDIDLAGNTGA